MSLKLSPRIKELSEEANRLHQQDQNDDAFRVAISAYWEARRLHRKNPHPDIAETLYYLGIIGWSLGKKRAIVYIERSLALDLALLDGPPGQDIAQSLNSLAIYKNTWGFFAESWDCLEESERIMNRLIKENPDSIDLKSTYSSTLRGMGSVCRSQYRFLDALEYYKRSLNIEQSINSAVGIKNRDQTYIAATLNGLANVYSTLGDYEQSIVLFNQALKDAYEYYDSPELSAKVANLLHNKSNVLLRLEKYESALVDYKHALKIHENIAGDNKAQNLDVAGIYNGISQALQRSGQLNEAIQYSLDSLKMRYELQGETAEHPDIATNLYVLARIYAELGQDTLAIQRYEEALAMRKKIYHTTPHPFIAENLDSLALIYSQQGQFEKAWHLAKQSIDMANLLFRGYYTFLRPKLITRSERLSRLMLLTQRYFCKDSEKVRATFESVSQYKAMETQLRLDMRTKISQERYPEHEHLIARWDEINQTIAQQSWESLPKNRERLSDLKQERMNIEQVIFLAVPELRQEQKTYNAHASDIARHLPEGHCLVEYIHYEPYDQSDQNWQVPRYAAFVLSKDDNENAIINLVDFGPASVIDPHVHLLREGQTYERDHSLLSPSGSSEIIFVEEELEILFHKAWQPLLKSLGGRKRVLVAPDGELNFVPFEALIPQANAGYLIDFDYRITYLTSGRDILRYERQWQPSDTARIQLSQTVVILGNPAFGYVDSDDTSAVATGAFPANDNQGDSTTALPVDFPPIAMDVISSSDRIEHLARSVFRKGRAILEQLPFAELEAKRIADRFSTEPHIGIDAQLDLVRKVRSPHILHIATHAFFLDESDVSTLQKYSNSMSIGERFSSLSSQSNAFLRGVIFLAGANKFLKTGNVDPVLGSGILAGEEISSLDLRDTPLVVMSACDSGLGAADTGRGVMGLRASFQEAGCHCLVATLWSVDDIATAILMDRMYELLIQRLNRGDELPVLVDECLRQAQQYLRKVTARHLVKEWFTPDTLDALKKMQEDAKNPAERYLLEQYIYEVELYRDPQSTDWDSSPYAHPRYWSGFCLPRQSLSLRYITCKGCTTQIIFTWLNKNINNSIGSKALVDAWVVILR